MKKAMFTLFRLQRLVLIRRMTLLLFLTWGFLGITYLPAQIVTQFSMNSDTCTVFKFSECGGKIDDSSTLFTDDGALDGLYADSRARRDTIEVCPDGDKDFVMMTFSEFDLEEGDTLFAFNINKQGLRDFLATGSGIGTGANAPFGAGSGTGTGVSKAFGGWINASCDPLVNSSGCLTFLFQTDGDNAKGRGWEAWTSCAEREITIGPVSIPSKILTVDSAAYGNITIPAPHIIACNDTLPTQSDSVRLIVRNLFGTALKDTVLTFRGLANSIADTFAIGSYLAEYTLLSHTDKQLRVPFYVQAPTLACNDNIQIPFGSACEVRLNPDDILEQPADTIADTMYYNITITVGSGKNQVVKTTQNFDNHNAVAYPTLTVDDIRNAGMSLCGGTATVRIERIYYQLGGTTTICNNGIQRNACETIVEFVDKSPPFISVAGNLDTLVACDTTGLLGILNPQAIDNCSENISVYLDVRLDETDDCFNNNGSKDTTKAIINFRATDECGNTGQTTREVVIIRPDENQHIARTSNLVLSCEDTQTPEAGMPGLQIGIISNSQFVARDTIPLSTEEYRCGFILSKRDEEIPATDCGRKLFRYWSIVDWCAPETGLSPIDTQLIEFIDTLAPSFISNGQQERILEIGPFDCTFDITTIPQPLAEDNCSTPTVRLDSIFRIEDGQPWPVPRFQFTSLDADSFHVRWIAEDDCHEQLENDTLVELILIKDVTRPTAICADQLNISVGSNNVTIDTADVDAGSYDACGIINKELSRDGINFGPTVTFTCDDVKDTVAVYFRVTDKGGNTNTCWINVTPEDKIRPICVALPQGVSFANGDTIGNTAEVRIRCNDAKVAAIVDLYSPTAEELARIGGPLPAPNDNCINAENIELAPLVIQSGVCNQNIYQRRWIARDVWGLESIDTCTQTIYIEYVEDWEITLPRDINLTCPVTETNIDSVTIRNGNCDKLAVSVETQMFDVVPDACFKVIKTYHIINWCNYRAGDAPTHTFSEADIPEDGTLSPADIPNLSYITYTQVIKVDDLEGPQVELGEVVDNCIFGEHDGKLETVGGPIACGEVKSFSASAIDCVTDAGGELFFTFKIYQGSIDDVLANRAVVIESSDQPTPGNDAIVLAQVQPGTYTAEFVFTDNCGNATLAREEYDFIDCKKPTPYLLNGIAIELGQNSGTVAVWANDFDQGSFDNCVGQDSLTFRIWHPSLGFNPPVTVEGVLDSLPTSILFNCNLLGTQIVNIYVVDKAMNFDFAATFVLIQDNMRVCQTLDTLNNMVAGEIINPNGESVEGVQITVSGGSQNSMTTEADGYYQFSLARNGNYTLIPEKNVNPLNGVSTFDLVGISKHILGITSFDSPYKYIAADINKSGSITAFDMVQLRQLILQINNEFPNNQSWRFVDEGYEFISDNPANEDFREFISISNLLENQMNTNFVGIKIGDINGNAIANNLSIAQSRESKIPFLLQLKDQFVEKGEEVTVDFTTKTLETIQGYQFTLDFSGMELLSLKEGLAKQEHFNVTLADKNVLTTSWNGLMNESELFSLRFKAKSSGLISDFLQVNSNYTTAEAYDLDGQVMDITLTFTDQEAPHIFDLFQNSPNPFKDETVISFFLPISGEATLRIMDVQGKLLETIEGTYPKGFNQIRWDARKVGITGVLQYQLETSEFTATKKMLIIE